MECCGGLGSCGVSSYLYNLPQPSFSTWVTLDLSLGRPYRKLGQAVDPAIAIFTNAKSIWREG